MERLPKIEGLKRPEEEALEKFVSELEMPSKKITGEESQVLAKLMRECRDISPELKLRIKVLFIASDLLVPSELTEE